MNFYDRETDTIFRPLHAPSEGKCYYEESVFEQQSPSCDLSVIVPCYNGEKYLRPLLEQLAAQKTAYRCEVILVDDGSADGTLPLLQQFAENRTGWRVFSQKNGGTASARNAGIRVSRGKYLMFIDSDDSVSEGYFEKLTRTAYESDAELAICAYESRTDQDVCVRRVAPKNAQDRSVLNGCPWGKVFRRELFAHVLFPQGFWFEDTILAFLVYPCVQHFAATEYCACGTDSGIYYFGKECWEQQERRIHNAIETERFRFQPEVRARLRRQQDLDGHLVIGHVGRFHMQKNHKRLLTIFAQLLQIRPDAVLLLLGGGELEQPLMEQAAALGIAGKVRFAGVCSNVNEWMQAMDLFVMPSLFEGLPVVGVEAQTAGLPCLFSDKVTDEVLLSPDSKRLSLKQPDEVWAQTIADMAKAPHTRENGVQYAVAAGYDIAIEAKKLQEWYLSLAQYHLRG